MAELDAFPEDWDRALAVVAHPDDMEYGAASAVARWTTQGKAVSYVLVSSGEAGIRSLAPEECGPIRCEEQRASCRVVGVTDLEFLGFPDGRIVEGLELREAITGAIRRYRPDVVLSINFRDSWGGPSWNHADHRGVGRAILDAVRDAANPWCFPGRGDAWEVRFAAFNGSPHPTHYVDTSATIDAGIRSLECHRTYLDNLGGDSSPADFLRDAAESAGRSVGVACAATFEVIG